MAEFVHLHNHTEYSLLDGACRITDDDGNPSELFRLIGGQYKMKALAITDHGNMFGAMEFYWAAKSCGIKPIIGCEVYVAPKSRFDKEQNDPDDDSGYYNHLILLAKDLTGYRNLMKIVSLGYTEGFYYKPRVDKEILTLYGGNLIALSACIAGEIPAALNKDNPKKALEAASFYRDVFGKDNFYIEIMDHGLENEKKVLPGLLDISKKTGIPLAATNDCHFLKKEDHEAHDILICIGTNKNIDEAKRLRYPNSVYYKSAEEMERLFSYCPEALKNTLAIAEKINLEIKTDQLLLPKFEVPKEYKDDKECLEKLCRQGLIKRYGQPQEIHIQRLERELETINKMGFASYFLIVADFIQYAKDNNIPVGPGRGSGAGAITAYSLGITDICPIKNGLLFERFLNPDRRSMPDLDIDFADTGRDDIIEYVRQKYGENKCAQIITFGSMQARQAIKDTARVMGFTPSESNNIAKLIPFGASIAEGLKESQELRDKIRQDDRIEKLIRFAQKIEGLKRHTGVHAAGMVIADEEIINYSPLSKGSKEITTTQYDGNVLPELGLLKVDFLALRTLTIIDESVKLIKEEKADFDIEKIPLDDAKAYKLLSQAKTMGIFQLESEGLRDLMRRLKPKTIDDITAMIALYRPGPMGSGMLDDFVERRHGHKQIKYDHPLQEPILKETYGVMLYQEQAMRMSMDLAGFTPGEADGLRKAMSKKNPEVMAAQREKFVLGAQKKDIVKRTADKIYDNIEKFGGYGFNKSHSAAYALVSYRTAYLKAHYPLKYITAMLNSEINRTVSNSGGNESPIVKYLRDAEEFGIKILPPDIQYSDVKFKIEGKNIRFGLLAVKTVGEGAAQSIETSRKNGGQFKNWDDFLQRVDLKSINKRALENLAKAGAFDCFGDKKEKTRAQIIKSIETSVSKAEKIKEEISSNQVNLFGSEQVLYASSLIETIELNPKEVLDFEKEALGFYLSGHPLDSIKKELALYSDFSLDNLPDLEEDEEKKAKIAGMLFDIKIKTSKKGKKYANFRLEDLGGSIKCVMFDKDLAQYGKYLTSEAVVIIEGTLKASENPAAEDGEKENAPPEFMVYSIKLLSEAKQKTDILKKDVFIKLSAVRYDKNLAQNLTELFTVYKGNSKVFFSIDDPAHGEFLISTKYNVLCSGNFISEVEKAVGKTNIVNFR